MTLPSAPTISPAQPAVSPSTADASAVNPQAVTALDFLSPALARSLKAEVDAYGPVVSPHLAAELPGDALSNRVCILAEFGLLSAIGPEARTFLNGQLTNDVLKLAEDGVQLDGYCTPKGRLLASFVEWPVADGIHLAVAAELAAPIAKRLSMFVMRAKLKIRDESAAMMAVGLQGGDLGTPLKALGFSTPQVWQCQQQGRMSLLGLPDLTGSGVRAMLWMPRESVAEALDSLRLPVVSSEGWRNADIQSGLPRIVRASSELFVPQMVNYDLIGAVNFKKGCYPGQEVVARSQYLGKLKRRMFKAQADPSVQSASTPMAAPGDDVIDSASGSPVGKVVMAAAGIGTAAAGTSAGNEAGGSLTAAGGVTMLIELQTSSASSTGLTVNGQAIRITPLPYEIPIAG